MSQFEFEDETNSPALNELLRELRPADRHDIADIKRDLERALSIVSSLFEGGMDPFQGSKARHKRTFRTLGYLAIAQTALEDALRALKR
jgi:hypothetical protein